MPSASGVPVAGISSAVSRTNCPSPVAVPIAGAWTASDLPRVRSAAMTGGAYDMIGGPYSSTSHFGISTGFSGYGNGAAATKEGTPEGVCGAAGRLLSWTAIAPYGISCGIS